MEEERISRVVFRVLSDCDVAAEVDTRGSVVLYFMLIKSQYNVSC